MLVLHQVANSMAAVPQTQEEAFDSGKKTLISFLLATLFVSVKKSGAKFYTPPCCFVDCDPRLSGEHRPGRLAQLTVQYLRDT
ncbi:MAG: hypothetical protein IKJ40_05300 [Bacteroidales bacterium]|nr:hypothetical protein [Bacteroidales bacterium]